MRPTPVLRQRYVAGFLGRKTGTGFYIYRDGNKVEPDQCEVPAATGSPSFWISRAIPEFYERVTDLVKTAQGALDEGERPGPDSIAIVTPLGADVTTACVNEGLDPERTLGVDALFMTDKRVCLMSNPAASRTAIDNTWAAFAGTGRAVTIIRDSAGFIAQRIIANIINTACDIAQEGVARPEDIDTGARLGLGYPTGPLALGDTIGAARVLEILERLQSIYGDPRYRPSIWLRRRAMLGLSLLHTETV